jgi:hypothetical protein
MTCSQNADSSLSNYIFSSPRVWLEGSYQSGKLGHFSKYRILRHQFNSSLLLHAIQSPFYWRILKKTKLFLTEQKKSGKQENSSLFMNKILKNEKMRVDNQTKIQVWEDST